MIYSPHTFEITLNLDTNKFGKLLDKGYGKAKGSNKLYPKNDKHCDHALTDHGIRIEYHNGTYKKKIKFIVNPTKMLGGNDIKNCGSRMRTTYQRCCGSLMGISRITSIPNIV